MNSIPAASRAFLSAVTRWGLAHFRPAAIPIELHHVLGTVSGALNVDALCRFADHSFAVRDGSARHAILFAIMATRHLAGPTNSYHRLGEKIGFAFEGSI
jgi:hypothetical protein